MNKLPMDKQELILSQLVEGNSIRSIERMTGVHRDTIIRLMLRAGEQADVLMSRRMRDIHSEHIQLDEIWGFVGKKQKRVTEEEKYERPELGDAYTFVAIDAATKLVPAYYVGKRDGFGAIAILEQLRDRIVTRYQLSTDSWKPYRSAVFRVYGNEAIDYGQVHKKYSEAFVAEKRYSPAKLVGITLRVIFGAPDVQAISTSYVERQNLTLRMSMRRLTRLTNAFSKKLENLQAAVALHFYYYNFMRVHSAHGFTPAFAAGITHREQWGWEPILR
jgi:IS1 family transposase